jgi:outer membrane protein assembly factor BamC
MLKTCLVGVIIVLMLVGCSKIVPKLDEVLPDRRTEYKKSKSLPDLEVPPDLTTDAIQDRMAIPKAGEAASFSTFQERAAERKRDQELERSESSAIKLLENETVLAVEGVTVQIWPQLRSFFEGLGYGLELDDEELGVIETAWNENQEELVRDKFKVFAEPGQEPGTTLLYVSHRGEELVPQGDKLVWQARTRDAALERRIVERIETSLAGGAIDPPSAPAQTQSTDRAPAGAPAASVNDGGPQLSELISAGGGKVYLALAEQFNEAWDSIGQALGRAGVEIDQEDRNRGIYIVRFTGAAAQEKQGMFSKLKFWGDDAQQLQLSLTGVGDKTEIVALNRDGQWETSAATVQFLTRLNQELNAGN